MQCQSSSSTKRTNLNEEKCLERLGELLEDLESVELRLAIKEKRLAQAETLRNYKLCDQLHDEIQELKDNKRKMTRELLILQLKEKRAKRYRESRTRSLTPASTLNSPTLLPRTSPRSPLSSTLFPRTSPVSIPGTSVSSRLTSPVSPSPPSLSPTSPLLVPKYTEDGCTSFSESLSGPESIQQSSKSQHFQ